LEVLKNQNQTQT